jgi:uncharacterized protein (TIGR01777 family)
VHVLVTGASGFIAGSLIPALERRGHHVTRLARTSGDVRWDLERGPIPPERIPGVEAVIHLAGASISRRWTAEHKRRIEESRCTGTRMLIESLGRLEPRPHTLISASAIGWYGDRGDEEVDERSAPGSGFLPSVARAWEEAAAAAETLGLRVVRIRTGLVLDPRGGALAKLLTPFRLGVGGPMGSGRHWWSWIAMDDLVGLFLHALERPRLLGPINATAPGAVRNREFARTLGRVLGRPALIPAPAFALRLLLGGEMADELLLGGAKVVPRVALETGYDFRFADLEAALRHLLMGRA